MLRNEENCLTLKTVSPPTSMLFCGIVAWWVGKWAGGLVLRNEKNCRTYQHTINIILTSSSTSTSYYQHINILTLYVALWVLGSGWHGGWLGWCYAMRRIVPPSTLPATKTLLVNLKTSIGYPPPPHIVGTLLIIPFDETPNFAQFAIHKQERIIDI